MAIRQPLVSAVVAIVVLTQLPITSDAQDVAECASTQIAWFFGNGILTDRKEAQDDIDRVLQPAIRDELGGDVEVVPGTGVVEDVNT